MLRVERLICLGKLLWGIGLSHNWFLGSGGDSRAEGFVVRRWIAYC